MDSWKRRFRAPRLWWWTAALGWALVATPAAAQESSSYRIGPRDKIEIRVLEVPDLDGELEVGDDGSVVLPNVGRIEAQGRTESELAAEIRQRLEAVGLRRATVAVQVAAYARPVSVLGAVVTPGNQFVSGRIHLLDVLLAAGGVSDNHDQLIRVRRRAANGLSDQVAIGVAELLEIGDPAVNIPIFAGDLVQVPAAPTIHVSFLGEVASTGRQSYSGSQRVTLLVAIAQAGGLTETASNKIRILRGQGDDKIEIVANYRRILNGKDPDVELEDGDIVVVKESFF